MDFNLDKWVELAKNGKLFSENELIKLCSLVSQIFLEESNVQHVSAPVKICGDIHGQFFDLEELFCIGGQVPDTNYIFMGDYVDRGYFSLKTLVRLLTLKARYPDRIVLLRGNHESRKISQVYGFYDECLKTYGSNIAWKYCCDVFDLMNVAAIIDNQIFCVHGGLSPVIDTIDHIRILDRYKEIPCSGPLSDIVWSDPDDVYDWEISPRGAGWLFGPLHTKKFMKINDLTLICRAHQLVDEGYRYMFDKSLVTVWSAPNYCYRCGNVAAIFEVESIDNHKIKIFQAVPDEKREIPNEITTPYFL